MCTCTLYSTAEPGGDVADTETMDNDEGSSLDGSADEAEDVCTCNMKCMLQNSTTLFNSQV